jgi:hypothetical protein
LFDGLNADIHERNVVVRREHAGRAENDLPLDGMCLWMEEKFGY